MGKNIAFIGRGDMGGPVAPNIAKASQRVAGFDLAPGALDHARPQGIEVAESAAVAAAGADVVITMHPVGQAASERAGRDCPGVINEIRANSGAEALA